VDDQQLLIMMVPSDIRDDVVDCLMGYDGISGFNMTTMAGYSKEHSQYDLREQVEGYRQFFKFEVMHLRAQHSELMSTLRPACATANIRYWIVPVLEQGHL
jgi:hypothetical protein